MFQVLELLKMIANTFHEDQINFYFGFAFVFITIVISKPSLYTFLDPNCSESPHLAVQAPLKLDFDENHAVA